MLDDSRLKPINHCSLSHYILVSVSSEPEYALEKGISADSTYIAHLDRERRNGNENKIRRLQLPKSLRLFPLTYEYKYKYWTT
mgnify:FL=1